MAEQHLDDADVDAAFQKMRGEAVAQRVHAHPLGQPRRFGRRTAGEKRNLSTRQSHIDGIRLADRLCPRAQEADGDSRRGRGCALSRGGAVAEVAHRVDDGLCGGGRNKFRKAILESLS